MIVLLLTVGCWRRLSATLVAAVLATTGLARPDIMLDENLPRYQQVSGVSGNLNAIGSDTLNTLITLWSEAFRAYYPNVIISVEGKGSSTAPPALIEGTAQLGPMSREMKATEIDNFERSYGYQPTLVPVGIDAVAVFVHKDNPLERISFAEIDGIFSSTYKSGGTPINTWGGLGLDGGWARRPISLYGRNSASGTYGFFKEFALRRGDFRNSVIEQPGSAGVVQAVASDVYGMGYSGIGYLTPGVRALEVGEDGRYYEPTQAHTLSGDYPLARFLIVYINKDPARPLDRLTLEFLRFALSWEGQRIVAENGYFPLPGDESARLLDMLAR